MPQRPRSHQLEEESNRAFEAHLPSRWVARKLDPDYGVDYTVEVFDGDNRATGRSFHAQLKSTDEPNLSRALGGVRFTRDTAEYYRSLSLPILVVLFHAPSQRLFGRWFHAYNPHVALREGGLGGAKSIRFQFYESDEFRSETPEVLEAGLRGFLQFRSPELPLPLRLAVTAAQSEAVGDPYPMSFALRRVLRGVSDIVTVEVRQPGADDPHVALEDDRAVVSLADVASVTLDHEDPSDGDVDRYAADVALGLSVALAYVGQANLSAQIASAVAPRSKVIGDFEVSMTIAEAMTRSQRVREAIQLADELDTSDDEDIRIAAFALLTVVLARGDRLTDDERALAIAVSEKRPARRREHGDDSGAAAEAYSLAMLHKRVRDAPAAIQAFRMAADLEDHYLTRGYYHSDFAGVLFENGDFREAAHHYGRALELGEGGLVLALHADALLFSGRYEAARQRLAQYLRSGPGPEGAEWRLKHGVLPLLIKTAGKQQDRHPGAADDLLAPWDFEQGPDMSPDAAWLICQDTLGQDACSGEAWFRLALLSLMRGQQPDEAATYAVTGAVLHRHNVGAWTNAVLFADPTDERTLSDLLYAAYRLCGDFFVEAITEALQSAQHFAGRTGRVIELLEGAVVQVDMAHTARGFTMRFMGEHGEVNELVFSQHRDSASPVLEKTVVWRALRTNPTAKKRKRPSKTYGRQKKRKRRK
jgi:hypothetical protein